MNVIKLAYMPTTKEDTMPEANISDVDSTVQSLHAKEPIMERKTHIFGMVKVYPPNADPSEWADHSWKLTTTNGLDKNTSGLCEYLRASKVWAGFERPHFITDSMRFGYVEKPKASIEPTPEPKETKVAEKPKKKPDTYKPKDVEPPWFS